MPLEGFISYIFPSAGAKIASGAVMIVRDGSRKKSKCPINKNKLAKNNIRKPIFKTERMRIIGKGNNIADVILKCPFAS
jgi:hypothetical protein